MNDESPGGEVLVVEDQFLIALDIEDVLLERGYARVRKVTQASAALGALAVEDFVLAIVAAELEDGGSAQLIDHLRTRAVPTVLVTARGHGEPLPAEFAGLPVVRKPFRESDLLAALTWLQ